MPAKQKILVVDHNSDLLIVLEKFLEDAGYETTTTWNSREALSLIDSLPFAAVIVGLKSARRSEIVRRLRQRKEDSLCIVLDRPECQLEREELHAMAVHAVISKWNLKEVVETLRQATSSKKPIAADSAA